MAQQCSTCDHFHPYDTDDWGDGRCDRGGYYSRNFSCGLYRNWENESEREERLIEEERKAQEN